MKIQTQANLLPLRRGRTPGRAMAVACVVAAATLPAWMSMAVAGVEGNPVTVAAVLVKAGGEQGSPGRESKESPGKPTLCAGPAKVASPDAIRSAGQPDKTVGCGGVPSNLAAIEPARFAV